MPFINTLPYDNCALNIEYLYGKNREISVSANMMLMAFLFITYYIYNNLSSRVVHLNSKIDKYVKLLNNINEVYHIFDYHTQNIWNPDELLEYFDEETECDTVSESGSENSDAEIEDNSELQDDSNRRVLRSQTRHNEVEYKFDRDYNIPLIRKRKSKSTSNLGIRGKTWQLD